MSRLQQQQNGTYIFQSCDTLRIFTPTNSVYFTDLLARWFSSCCKINIPFWILNNSQSTWWFCGLNKHESHENNNHTWLYHHFSSQNYVIFKIALLNLCVSHFCTTTKSKYFMKIYYTHCIIKIYVYTSYIHSFRMYDVMMMKM